MEHLLNFSSFMPPRNFSTMNSYFQPKVFYQSWPTSEGTIGGDGSGPSGGAFNSGLNQVERQMLPTMGDLWYYQVESPSNGGPLVLPSCLAGGGGSLHGPPSGPHLSEDIP